MTGKDKHEQKPSVLFTEESQLCRVVGVAPACKQIFGQEKSICTHYINTQWKEAIPLQTRVIGKNVDFCVEMPDICWTTSNRIYDLITNLATVCLLKLNNSMPSALIFLKQTA